VPRAPDCPIDPLASAGLDTIALRVPAHETAQQLLAAFDGPLVAPSANPSGRLSPSTAAHVAALLPEIDVLDGGDCAVGVESSIIGCLDETPLWLRAGGLARADIEAVLGQKLIELSEDKDATAKLAPGRLARHYAPKTALRLNADTARDGEWLIGFGPAAPQDCFANLSQTGDLCEAAAKLFAVLHTADAQAEAAGKTLAIMPIPQLGLGEALNDRLIRAAAH
jgi:L-threonylcarbamoyladenylate synthase